MLLEQLSITIKLKKILVKSIGSKYNNKLLGTFGDLFPFSFYFGRHMSTIERWDNFNE